MVPLVLELNRLYSGNQFSESNIGECVLWAHLCTTEILLIPYTFCFLPSI